MYVNTYIYIYIPCGKYLREHSWAVQATGIDSLLLSPMVWLKSTHSTWNKLYTYQLFTGKTRGSTGSSRCRLSSSNCLSILLPAGPTMKYDLRYYSICFHWFSTPYLVTLWNGDLWHTVQVPRMMSASLEVSSAVQNPYPLLMFVSPSTTTQTYQTWCYISHTKLSYFKF